MCITFTRAVLRSPGSSYVSGITSSPEGAPDVAIARRQHGAYAEALASLGLEVTLLPPDESYPDSTFVEDTAIVTAQAAIMSRPGAASRAGEIGAMGEVLGRFFGSRHGIVSPGTLDGGDVCETDRGVLIGLTERTNADGARQLAETLAQLGHPAEVVDVRGISGLLHLKTGISYLGDGRLAVAEDVAHLPAFQRFERVVVARAEAYAANCIRVNDRILVAAGYPLFARRLSELGYDPLPLEMSEFRKMDGGLSCLSLRF